MKIYRCQHCKFTVMVKDGDRKQAVSARRKMGQHYDTTHRELIPSDMDGYRWFYYLMTKKDHGSCIECKQPTEFNRTTMKYARFCNNPICKQRYKEMVDKRMIAKHGKVTLLNDPEHQKKMQAGRRIAGIYNWSDGVTKLPYLSSYEKDFFRFLDEQLHWPGSDIIAPSPHTYTYDYQGKSHFYMPDAFIPSMNLEVELKSLIRVEKQDPDAKAKDEIKDDLMKSCSTLFNYIKIVDKDYTQFREMINLRKGEKV